MSRSPRSRLGIAFALAIAPLIVTATDAAAIVSTPLLSVGDARVPGGTAGNAVARVKISLSEASATPVTLRYVTFDDAAIGGPTFGHLYSPKTGSMTFLPGQTNRTVQVTVRSPRFSTGGVFRVAVSDVVGARVIDPAGSVTVFAPSGSASEPSGSNLGIGDAVMREGDAGVRAADLVVRLSSPAVAAFDVTASTAAGTAGPSDFVPTSTVVHFAIGDVWKYVAIPLTPDTTIETTERFTVRLATSAVTLARPVGRVTIRDDDTPADDEAGWGLDLDGQLGIGGGAALRDDPQPIGFAGEWCAIAAGVAHSLALDCDGGLWSWGSDDNGQLGRAGAGSSVPGRIGTDTDWALIAAGWRSSFAIKDDGSLWAWGDNGAGQLGDGTTSDRAAPVVIGASAWAAIASGAGHTVAIRRDAKTLWGWGANDSGQVGDGTTTDRLSPRQVDSGAWRSVAAGGWHSLAIRGDDTVWAWGNNDQGQLGDGTVVDRNVPVSVSELATGTPLKALSVTAGALHSAAIAGRGVLLTWGSNAYGQIGQGSVGAFDPHPRVLRDDLTLLDVRGWQSVSAGGFHVVATRDDGSIWAWGAGFDGQIGDGTGEDRATPTKITAFAGFGSIVSAGGYHTIATGG